MPRSTKPWPDEIKAQVRDLISHGRSSAQVAQAVGMTRKAVLMGAHRYGLGPWLTPPGSPPQIPSDFAECYRRMSYSQLATHYGRSTSRISVWVSRLGLSKPRGPSPKPPTIAKPKPRRPLVIRERGQALPCDRVSRDYSPAGQAADFLRKFGPVKRCDASGVYTPHGDHWLRGSFLLTADEIIARAERQGWRYAA